MIVVKIEKNRDGLQHIEVSGHAKYDEYGKDIVCSSVSTCVITTINAILSVREDTIQTHMGDNQIIVDVQKPDAITFKLIENMLEMLSSLEEKYPKNIRLSKEEKICKS